MNFSRLYRLGSPCDVHYPLMGMNREQTPYTTTTSKSGGRGESFSPLTHGTGGALDVRCWLLCLGPGASEVEGDNEFSETS